MTVSDDEQMQADEGNWEEWDEDETEEDEPTKSLFSDNILPSPTAALKYDAVTHNFDFRQFRQKACSLSNTFSHAMNVFSCRTTRYAATAFPIQCRQYF